MITDSEEIAAKARALRNYGQDRTYHHVALGLNSRLDEIQAAILSVRLRWLKRFNERCRAIANRYLSEITNPKLSLMAAPVSPGSHVFHQFVILCRERDRLAKCLMEKGVRTLIHYPLPISRQPCFETSQLQPALPNAERHSEQCLSLPSSSSNARGRSGPCHPGFECIFVTAPLPIKQTKTRRELALTPWVGSSCKRGG